MIESIFDLKFDFGLFILISEIIKRSVLDIKSQHSVVKLIPIQISEVSMSNLKI